MVHRQVGRACIFPGESKTKALFVFTLFLTIPAWGEDSVKLLDILNDKLIPEEIQGTAFPFFGVQGAWYTVGWKMAGTIERSYESKCDPILL